MYSVKSTQTAKSKMEIVLRNLIMDVQGFIIDEGQCANQI